MYNIIYNRLIAFHKIRTKQGLSEQALCKKAHVSRMTLRNLEKGEKNVTLKTISQISSALGFEINILAVPNQECLSEYSAYAVAKKAQQDGIHSWKTHFMDFVDEFRNTLDYRLLLLPPPQDLSLRLKELLSAIVLQLCKKQEIDPPTWALKKRGMKKPWFVSNMESLKALAIIESPICFRERNIFVHSNFLERV